MSHPTSPILQFWLCVPPSFFIVGLVSQGSGIHTTSPSCSITSDPETAFTCRLRCSQRAGSLHTSVQPSFCPSLSHVAVRMMGDSLRCCQSLSSTPPPRPSCKPGPEKLWSRSCLLPLHRLDALLRLPGKNPARNLRASGASGPVTAPTSPPPPPRAPPSLLRLIWARFCAVLAQLPIYPSPARRFLHSTAAESVPVLPATRRTPPPPGPTRGSSASPPSAHFSLGEASGTPGRVSGPVAGAHGRAAEASPGRLIQARFCACPPPPSRSRRARERREQAACHCWCPAPARSARPAVPTGPVPRLLLRPPRGRDAAAPASSRVAPVPAGSASGRRGSSQRCGAPAPPSAGDAPADGAVRARERRRRAAGACGAARAAALTLRPLPSGDAGKSPGHTRAASVGAAELRGRCGQPAPPRGAPPRPSPPSSDAAPAPPPPRLAPREGRRPARPGPGPPPERRDLPFLSFLYFFYFSPLLNFGRWRQCWARGRKGHGGRPRSDTPSPLPPGPGSGR